MAIKLVFSEFNSEQMVHTCTQWRKDAAKGLAFPSDIEQLISWVQTHDKHQDADSMAFGIFAKGSPVAEGICEFVVTRVSKSSPWVKMLRLRLKPTLDERIYLKDINAQGEAMDVFVSAIGGVVKLTNVHAAKTLKIFGRSNDQLSFLQTLAVSLQKSVKDVTVKIDGRWLVVNVQFCTFKEIAMNTVLEFKIQQLGARTVADALTPELIAVAVIDAIESYGLEEFANAFTAYGEQAFTREKLAA